MCLVKCNCLNNKLTHCYQIKLTVPSAVYVVTVVSGSKPASQLRAAEESTTVTLLSIRHFWTYIS